MTPLRRNGAGFTLVELMLASSLGLMLFGVALRLLMGDAAITAAMAETLQVRRWQRRTLALIQSTWLVLPVGKSILSLRCCGLVLDQAGNHVWRSCLLMVLHLLSISRVKHHHRSGVNRF